MPTFLPVWCLSARAPLTMPGSLSRMASRRYLLHDRLTAAPHHKTWDLLERAEGVRCGEASVWHKTSSGEQERCDINSQQGRGAHRVCIELGQPLRAWYIMEGEQQTKTRRRAPAPKNWGVWTGGPGHTQAEGSREGSTGRGGATGGVRNSTLGRRGKTGPAHAQAVGRLRVACGGWGALGSSQAGVAIVHVIRCFAASIDQSSRRSRGGTACVCQGGPRPGGANRPRLAEPAP